MSEDLLESDALSAAARQFRATPRKGRKWNVLRSDDGKVSSYEETAPDTQGPSGMTPPLAESLQNAWTPDTSPNGEFQGMSQQNSIRVQRRHGKAHSITMGGRRFNITRDDTGRMTGIE